MTMDYSSDTTNYTTAGSWYNTNSGNTMVTNTRSYSAQLTGSGPTCNESLKHDHEQKAVFHGMKSAFRLISSGRKGVENRQVDEAMRIAAEVGKAYLQTEGIEYDPERSRTYLEEKFLDKSNSDEVLIERAIERAWNKIDSGEHAGGARIAVSLGDEFLHDFRLPE